MKNALVHSVFEFKLLKLIWWELIKKKEEKQHI